MSTFEQSPRAPGSSRMDLSALAGILERRFRAMPPLGYVRGKTRIRNALVDGAGLSALRAEVLVDEMQARGFLRYTGDPGALDETAARWLIVPKPLCAS